MRGARLQDQITAAFAKDLDKSLRDLNRRIRRLVLDLESKGGALVSTKANLGRALRLRSEIRAAIDAAGFGALATASVDQPLDDLAELVLKGRSIAAQAARVTPVDVDTLVAFKELRLADLQELGDDMVTAINRTTLDGVLGSRPIPDLVDDLENLLEVSARQARTLYDTGVSTYTRTVHQLGTSGESDELFFYGGPVDGKVRPFCLERVGRVFTRDEISGMDNGQLPNVMLTGGGYNCRHVWSPVSKLDDELRNLANTGERLPSVEEQITDSATSKTPERGPVGQHVSTSLSIPSGSQWDEYRSTMADIDGVHGNGPLDVIPLQTTTASGVNGSFRFAEDSEGKVVADKIVLNPKTATPATLMHEVGHWVDYSGLPKALNLPDTGQAASWQTSSHPALQEWREAVNGSRAIKTLKRWDKVPVSGYRRNGIPPVDKKYTSYLLQSHEVFARSYSQYVARKSGNRRALDVLSDSFEIGDHEVESDAIGRSNRDVPRSTRLFGSDVMVQRWSYPKQWSDDDFAPIEAAFDKLFKSAGWRK